MKYFDSPPRETWEELCKRPSTDNSVLLETAKGMFDRVRREGDKALREFTARFDGVQRDDFIFQSRPMEELEQEINPELQVAIRQAYSNIHEFHARQRQGRIAVETMPGVQCWQEPRPIQRVGLYIPGGTAPLFSTILMLAVPARIAGCQEITLCTPPVAEGEVNPVMQFTAHLCGLDRWVTLGGMQAMAALSIGTESIPRVDKLFGPGNQYVTAGKQYASLLGTAIDMPAGPSELLVLADDSAPANYVASDLLSQAEHGVDSQVMLVSISNELVQRVNEALRSQLPLLPRKEIAKRALDNSKAVTFRSREEALEFVDFYAAEHLIICTGDDDYFAQRIGNAGSVFLGPYSPESAGDYASGTNHTLPTAGFARTYSGVNLQSFTKSVTFQRIDAEGLKSLGPHIEKMAEAEHLQAHKNAVSIRLADLTKEQ